MDWLDMNTCVGAPEEVALPDEMQYEITLAEINAYSPCLGLHAEEFVEFENPTYTLIDVLDNGIALPIYKVWVITKFAGKKINRLMAVWALTWLFDTEPVDYPLAVFNAMDAALNEIDGILTYEEVAEYYHRCEVGAVYARQVMDPPDLELEKAFGYGCGCTKHDHGDGTFTLLRRLGGGLDDALEHLRGLIEEERSIQEGI